MMRILARSEGNTGWRTDWRVDIKILESQPILGQPINIWRVGANTSEAGKVRPSHVVDQNENNVRTWSDCLRMTGRRKY